MNFVPCLTWVKRGVSKSNPEKVRLLKDQLKELIEADSAATGNPDDKQDEEHGTVADADDITAKYGLDTYDDEDDAPTAMSSLAGLAMYASNADDPYLEQGDDEESEEEVDDFTIRPTDNLITVARVDEQSCATVEVYVNNHHEDHLYVHHDIILPAYPLCIEWLSFDPAEESGAGNFVAIGDMHPIINVWDLDIVDTLEPAYKLGKKTKKKKAKKVVAMKQHEDAVLSLSWNKQAKNLLVSGSADYKALVWDLSSGVPTSCISAHREKVQSVMWHPFEAYTLLTGGCDNAVKLWDSRNISAGCKTWTLDGEVEKVLWNHFDPFYFYASTDAGRVYGFDARMDQPAFTLSAHTKAVSGMVLSAHCPGCLITASEDKSLKVWDVLDHKPTFVFEKENLKVGSVLALANSPDEPFVVAVGGDDKAHGFAVVDLKDWTSLSRFEGRKLLSADLGPSLGDTPMEMDAPAGALTELSLEDAEGNQ
ncbi:periodic tryptophan protein 1 homolog [Ixodes scapularis]|uniref:periodic tryptophan protein 1 homolog n=1 Tax=Ixodes scapularis TaxID=6945 RepID=UPI001C3845D3|nr:periodic tryptophan protein 1 homolog [Ixodes scapularis]